MYDSKPSDRDFCAAEYLEGVELPNGWKVLHRLSNSTGGNFGVSYEVERELAGRRSARFLKLSTCAESPRRMISPER